jgi:DNA polymerase-1
MFLFQSLKYNYSEDTDEMVKKFKELQPNYVVYDTETTGLDFIHDIPFLVAVGFDRYSFVFEINEKNIKNFEYIGKNVKMLLAHNAKYDYHMMKNIGVDMENWNLGDSMTIARLTQYADKLSSLSLEALGQEYVHENSKFAGKAIQNHLNEINKGRRTELRNYIKEHYPKKYKSILESYDSRVAFVDHEYNDIFAELDAVYTKPNYYDSYKEKPDLMKRYACDDVVIMLEYLKKSLPILKQVDPGMKTFHRESKLISIVAEMERIGLQSDQQYLIDSRIRLQEYQSKVYKKLHQALGTTITAGQHKKIKQIFNTKYNIMLMNSDVKALETVKNYGNPDATAVADMIIELRHIDKWLTTYIEGMLNRISSGKIHTSINNSGAVSGRVSSDMQQQPKDPLLDDEGNELFHPRRVFINPEEYKTYYFDYSQMELRMQAQYTVNISGGDKNLCRAYIPFECKSAISGESFDVFNPDHLAEWDNGMWVDENDQPWEPVDLHSVTTLTAFPHLTPDHPEFSKFRKYGKVANFLKNYGGGVQAIKAQLGVDDNIATALDEGYYKAFPKVLDYQKWVSDSLFKYGFVENLYGRRYYMQDSRWFYKAINYVIQGGCADMVKDRQIAIYEFLKSKKAKSKMLLPIHDEIQVLIHDDERHLVKQIADIMWNVGSIMKNIPMICDVEMTDTNWAEKYKVDYEK